MLADVWWNTNFRLFWLPIIYDFWNENEINALAVCVFDVADAIAIAIWFGNLKRPQLNLWPTNMNYLFTFIHLYRLTVWTVTYHRLLISDLSVLFWAIWLCWTFNLCILATLTVHDLLNYSNENEQKLAKKHLSISRGIRPTVDRMHVNNKRW